MTEVLRKNFEPGKLLLVATLLMSLTLISQLYVMSESIDLSNGLQLTGMELSLTVSYLFTALSMVIVINEFFQVKTKMKGLLVLTHLIAQKNTQSVASLSSLVEISAIEKTPLENILEKEALLKEIDFNDETDFDTLLEEEFEEKQVEDELAKYKTTKIKIDDTSEIEPLIEEGELKNIFDELEEASEMDRMLAESEVIQTLTELETIVKELKRRKVPATTE